MYIPDNYDIWASREDEKERNREKLPVCADCGEPVMDDHYYLINDEVICPDCLESGYRKEIEDYID